VKIPVIYNNDYIVFLENDCGFTFIHCDCVRWTKEVKKEAAEVLGLKEKKKKGPAK
jgi:hypothetical protein